MNSTIKCSTINWIRTDIGEE